MCLQEALGRKCCTSCPESMKVATRFPDFWNCLSMSVNHRKFHGNWFSGAFLTHASVFFSHRLKQTTRAPPTQPFRKPLRQPSLSFNTSQSVQKFRDGGHQQIRMLLALLHAKRKSIQEPKFGFPEFKNPQTGKWLVVSEAPHKVLKFERMHTSVSSSSL